MADIVERLRAEAADVPIALGLDAAAEIERLRAALQKLAYSEWGEYPFDSEGSSKNRPLRVEGNAMSKSRDCGRLRERSDDKLTKNQP
jgi:hypothetical protein